MSYKSDSLEQLLAEQAVQDSRRAKATGELSKSLGQLFAEQIAMDNRRVAGLNETFDRMLAEV